MIVTRKKKIQTKNNLTIEVYDLNRKLVNVYHGSNLITTLGFKILGSRLVSATYDPMAYIAVGTGDTAPTVDDTTLETETYRQAATISFITTDVTDDTLNMMTIFDITADVSLTEAGIFNAASAGEMFARHTFSALDLLEGWQVKVIWQFDFD
jgi:hypothetical protein